jgi:hypoxanthine-guanine phosphoribosyltransferase
MKVNELFSSDMLPDLTIEDKVEILGLTEERIEYLKNTEVKEYIINENDCVMSEKDVINSDDVIGTIRTIEKSLSWYDFLNEKCHKDNTIRFLKKR